MVKLISSSESETWDKILLDFPHADIYYTLNYCKAFKIHKDGEPNLIFFESDYGTKGICTIMLRDIASSSLFSEYKYKEELKDAVTPYGYGGFIFDKEPSEKDLNQLRPEYVELLSNEKIVSLFVRFHPVLNNAKYSRELMDVFDLGKTITIDLSDKDKIWENIISKNRNVIRKSNKSGVIIKHGKGDELMKEFVYIYEETMRNDHAADYYFFSQEFYDSIINDLSENYEIFYAEYEGKIISAAIMIFKGTMMSYHLSGTLRDFRNLGAGNALLYEASLWGHANGFKSFHLGGGVGSGEDSLYKFKSAFNRLSNNQFSIGKLVIDTDRYENLVNFRKNIDPNFNPESKFFPLYRS